MERDVPRPRRTIEEIVRGVELRNGNDSVGSALGIVSAKPLVGIDLEPHPRGIDVEGLKAADRHVPGLPDAGANPNIIGVYDARSGLNLILVLVGDDLGLRLDEPTPIRVSGRHPQKEPPLLEEPGVVWRLIGICLLYTSDAADDLLCVDLGGRRIIK